MSTKHELSSRTSQPAPFGVFENGLFIGRVEGLIDGQRPLVSWGSEPPRVASFLGAPDFEWKHWVGRQVVLGLLGGDPEQPIILGPLSQAGAAHSSPRALRVQAKRELVLECGRAKIALSADGRIEIRGGHLVSRSSGPNKVKGSSVHIN